MRSLLVASLTMLALVGCKVIDGNLDVKESFSIKAQEKYDNGDGGNWNRGGEKINLTPGAYEMTINSVNKYSAQLSFKGQGGNQSVTIDLPKNAQFPTERGLIDIKGSEMNQMFNLKGAVETKYTDSESRRDWESCQYTDYETVCDGGPRPSCWTRTVTRSGYRHVEFFDRHSDTVMNFDFTSADGVKTLAQFHGEKSGNERVYTSQMPCR